MVKIISKYLLVMLLFMPVVCSAQTVSDYLILEDIDHFKFITQTIHPLTKKIVERKGYTVSDGYGILSGTGHFSNDHGDMTYETDYESEVADLGVEVKVTHHTGGDSDQWLLHEVEDLYRDTKKEKLGQINDWARLRDISGNQIFYYGGGIVSYTWRSNNDIIEIEFTNFSGPKSEPLEIIQAYTQKFPSTIPTTLQLDQAHNEKWIKDEIERRLWLCDKWFAHQATNNTDIKETIREINRNLTVFFNYRDKYYGISAFGEKEDIYQLESTQNLQGMKDKLTKYKAWWSKNKSRRIL